MPIAPTPTYSAVYIENGPVPWAGSDPRIQAGATWTNFGPPAIDNAGNLAFLGSWKAPIVPGPPKLPKQTGSGLFGTQGLVAKIGDPVPGLNGVTWAAFTDPLVGLNGGLVFIATFAGAGVTPANATAVCGIRSGSTTLEILAREGDVAVGTSGATYASFTAVAVDMMAFAWTAILTTGSGTPAVSKATNAGAWCSDQPGSSYLFVREGQPLDGKPVSSFQFLTSSSTSPGAGRGYFRYNSARGVSEKYFQATFSDGSSCLCTLFGQGSVGYALSGIHSNLKLTNPGLFCASFGMPTYNGNVNGGSFIAKLANYPGQPAVTPANAYALLVPAFINEVYVEEVVVRTGDACPGFDAGEVFASLGDPVGSSTMPGVAIVGTATGGAATSSNNVGIWWYPDLVFYPGMTIDAVLVAREGAQPPGASPGTVYKTFTSLALPGGISGPIFTAQLGGDVTTNGNDVGLYGMRGDGTMQELVREGNVVLGKTVKNFNALRAITGCAGSSRSYNETGMVAVLMNFTDNTMALVRVNRP